MPHNEGMKTIIAIGALKKRRKDEDSEYKHSNMEEGMEEKEENPMMERVMALESRVDALEEKLGMKKEAEEEE